LLGFPAKIGFFVRAVGHSKERASGPASEIHDGDEIRMMAVSVRNKAVLAAMAILLALVTLTAVPAAAYGQHTPFHQIPIAGDIPAIDGTFEGTFDLERFVRQGGQILAVGTLTGTLFDAAGNVIGTVENFPVRLPVNIGQNSTCEILFLQLGPLNLDLLGLVVFLDTVTLEITAEQGPGNLLGNLLCAIAGLLDNPGNLTNQLTQLLNQILRILG
jgi:hypothetical protein